MRFGYGACAAALCRRRNVKPEKTANPHFYINKMPSQPDEPTVGAAIFLELFILYPAVCTKCP